MTLHFRPMRPVARCASERIADRRKVDMTAELKEELRGRSLDGPKPTAHNGLIACSNHAARTTTQPWYVGNREYGEEE